MLCKGLNETSLILRKKNVQKVREVPAELYVFVKQGTETAPNNFTNYKHLCLGQVLTHTKRTTKERLISPLYVHLCVSWRWLTKSDQASQTGIL
jgi:hypothetical protein